MLRAGLCEVPEKMTSSMPEARMLLYELSPITQRSASSKFDLPQPLGPTPPVSPFPMISSVGSTNDLKPESLSRENFITPPLQSQTEEVRLEQIRAKVADEDLLLGRAGANHYWRSLPLRRNAR